MAQKKLKGDHTSEDIAAAYDPFAALRRLGWRSLKFEYDVDNVLGLRKGGGFEYNTFPLGLRVPMNFYLEVHSLLLQLNLKFQSPYYTGSFNPQFIERESTLELLHHYKRFTFGAGFKFIEGNFTGLGLGGIGPLAFLNNSAGRVQDLKLGLKFGYTGNKFDTDVTIYPRYLFRDSQTGTAGTTAFDRNFASFIFRTKGTTTVKFWGPRFIFGFDIDEWYITEYLESGLSGHYFGYYSLTLGIFFGNFQNKNEEYPMQIEFLIINRAFFRDLADPDPFAFGNGQGFFGLSTVTATSGNIFPGFLYSSHMIQINYKIRLFNFLTVKTGLTFEYAPDNRAPFHFLIFNIKVGIHY